MVYPDMFFHVQEIQIVLHPSQIAPVEVPLFIPDMQTAQGVFKPQTIASKLM